MSAFAMTSDASTSAIRLLATSSAARCLVSSSLKIGAPFSTSPVNPTKISATRPFVSGRIGIVRK